MVTKDSNSREIANKQESKAALQSYNEMNKAEETFTKKKRLNRRTRNSYIPHDRICRYCNEVKLQSKAWVVRSDVVMCRSCYNNVKVYIKGKPLPKEGTVDWNFICKSTAKPVEDCRCVHCVLMKISES